MVHEMIDGTYRQLICRTSRRNILAKREELRLAEIEFSKHARTSRRAERGCQRCDDSGLRVS
jgi:hypothetical protein